jgi:hypothetical protein
VDSAKGACADTGVRAPGSIDALAPRVLADLVGPTGSALDNALRRRIAEAEHPTTARQAATFSNFAG